MTPTPPDQSEAREAAFQGVRVALKAYPPCDAENRLTDFVLSFAAQREARVREECAKEIAALRAIELAARHARSCDSYESAEGFIALSDALDSIEALRSTGAKEGKK